MRISVINGKILNILLKDSQLHGNHTDMNIHILQSIPLKDAVYVKPHKNPNDDNEYLSKRITLQYHKYLSY